MKKIKLLATFLLMIIIITTFDVISRAATGTVNDKATKIRREPKETSTVIDLLNKGDEVEILESEDGWHKVKATTTLGRITGYVKQDTITVKEETPIETPNETPVEIPEEPQVITPVVMPEIQNIEENKEYTAIQEITLRVLPLMSSREKAKITGNVKVIEILNDWARVENNTEIGWTRINALKKALTVVSSPVVETPTEEPTEPTPEQKPEQTEPPVQVEKPAEPETIEMNKVGYVKTEGLRVRKGPSTDTEEITSFSKNHEVKIIGKTGNWYKIDMDGKIGYVSAKYISDTKIAETTSRDGSTIKNETPAAPATSTTGAAIVEFAKQYLGCNYVMGGASPSTGFDCSGFTQYVYKQFGISINRTSKAQINNGVAIQKSELQPGDLLIFNNDANTAIGHVGIYIGDGNFIHAANRKDGVKITPLQSEYYLVRYVGARRVI